MSCLAAAGLRGKLKGIIGGAPVTQQYADTIGADGYSASASGAVQLARKLMADDARQNASSVVPRGLAGDPSLPRHGPRVRRGTPTGS